MIFARRSGWQKRGISLSGRMIRRPVDAFSRAAVLVSSRAARKSTMRNRIRRTLLASLKKELLEVSLPYDVVVTVFSVPQYRLAHTLRAELHSLMQYANAR